MKTMKKRKRIITSFSGVITNSSTEVFLIQGPDALRQMIGTGVYKKYQKDFLVLRTEEDVEYFFRLRGKVGFNQNYSVYDLSPLLGKTLFNLWMEMINEFPENEETIWEMFKPKIMERLKNTIIYIDIKNNQRIMKRLEELYPTTINEESLMMKNLTEKGFRYGRALD